MRLRRNPNRILDLPILALDGNREGDICRAVGADAVRGGDAVAAGAVQVVPEAAANATVLAFFEGEGIVGGAGEVDCVLGAGAGAPDYLLAWGEVFQREGCWCFGRGRRVWRGRLSTAL